MSIPTWPGNLPSREIYAGDIAGLRAGIQRIESMVGGSDSWEDRTISLVPVTDQVDSTLHRRIYEPASLADRGWIPGTMGMPPEIFRNGVSVFTDEYTLHPADGFVVFHAQQAVNAIITAAVRVPAGQAALLARLPVPSNIRPAGMMLSPAITGEAHVAVTLPANTQILLPFAVHRRSTIDRCAVRVETGVSGTIWAGIYDASGDTHYPSRRRWHSAGLSTATAGPWLLPTDAASGLVLEPGLHWLMLHSNVAVSLRGVPVTALPNLGALSEDLGPSQFIGYLRAATAGVAPVFFPVGAGLHRVVSGTLAVPTLYVRFATV